MKRTLFVLLLAAGCASVPPAPSPQAPPPQQPPSSKSPNALTPTTATRAIAEPRIRVGMLTDQHSVTFPRIDGGYLLVDDSGAAQLLRRGFTDSAPLPAGTPVHFAVQVSSLTDQASANALVEKLRGETGQRVDATFDPASGFWAILAGDFPNSTAAEQFRGELTQRGYGATMLIVRRPTDVPFTKQHDVVDDEGDRATIAGQSLLVMPAAAETIVIDKKPYRTAARIWINSRGQFNVINELSLEDYLRGVVPAEMGPRVFDELEAQKAQAIAARTYAVRNLGQFRREGYDICPTPACQAYLGADGEEALSDQAVKATAGLIATYNGQPIDALFTATCGGETSDVGVMFPGRNEPYLRRARCVELEMTSIAGRADSGMLNEQQLNARLFTAIAGEATGFEEAISRVAPGEGHLRSASRADVLVFLANRLHLGMNLTLPEDRKYFFPQSADGPAYAAAAFLVKFGFLPAQFIDRVDLADPMPREELYGLLGSWLKKRGGFSEVTGKISAVSGRRLTLKAEGKNTTYTLPEGIPIFRRLVDRWQEYRSVPVMIGDRAFLQVDGRKVPIALVVQANIDGASFDRTSSFANWTRS
ncbi:MAG TPA: SpoIID/LytB domain-containing protein, partial [Thermoanaerobaculia bacterium]|nr:SpoIID/LytB domain-containing protein [Thermoanaerobaculia bacterium]